MRRPWETWDPGTELKPGLAKVSQWVTPSQAPPKTPTFADGQSEPGVC